MARVSLVPSRALADLLRQRRLELGLTLRQVQQETEALGRPIPFTTLARVEQGRVDPGVKRLHFLLRLYHLPVELAADLLDLEEFAGQVPKDAPSATLYEEGVKAWKEGDLRRALSNLFALRANLPADPDVRVERQRSLLAFAIAAGSLGRHRLSLQIVSDLLLETPDRSLIVSVLLQAAICWHWLGSDEAALGFLARAETHVRESDHQQLAWLHHARASALLAMGALDQAEASLNCALQEYGTAKDDYGASRALAVGVKFRFAQNDPQRALEAARAAREHATARGYKRLAILRKIDEGHAQVLLHDEQGGLAALQEALSASVAEQDAIAQFYSHYYLWKAHAGMSNGARAALELQAAQYYVRFVDEATPEVMEVRTMLGETRA
jgi:transcriptional regulator with XRE-family HTH domain